VTKNLEGLELSTAYRIDDQTAFTILQHLRQQEGLFLGLSSAINVAGALRLAKDRGPGQVIVTILCDSGHKYLSKLHNPEWTQANGLRSDLPIESVL